MAPTAGRVAQTPLNPFRPDRLITFAWHPGDVPRGIIADIVEDLGITLDEFYFGKF